MRSKIEKVKIKKWFNKVFNDKYKELEIISKSLNRNLNNSFLRPKFLKLRKVYKSLCRKLKHRYDQQLIQKIEPLQTRDPNNFWNLIKQLETGKKIILNEEDWPPLHDMQDHYMKLLKKQFATHSIARK